MQKKQKKQKENISTKKCLDRIDKHQNQRIIMMINRKLHPAHYNPYQRHYRDLNQTATIFKPHKPKQYDIIPQREQRVMEIMSQTVNSPLISKSRHYIKERKKVVGEQLEQHKKKENTVSILIRLFENKDSIKKQEFMELMAMRRQISKTQLSFNPKYFPDIDMSKISNTTEQESQLMNARIRQKLNHRKLITLGRMNI